MPKSTCPSEKVVLSPHFASSNAAARLVVLAVPTPLIRGLYRSGLVLFLIAAQWMKMLLKRASNYWQD
jgi:hypothetical protein